MWEKLLFLRVEVMLSPRKNALSNQGVIGETAIKNTPRKIGRCNKKTKALGKRWNLRVASLPKKKASTKRSDTPRTILTRKEKIWSVRRRLQQPSSKSVAEPPATADMVSKTIEKVWKMRQDMPQSPEPEARQLVLSGFYD